MGSGNWIPLSLIKMQICTVNEGSNLETISPGQVSHQLLSSMRRLGVECTATQDTSGPASKEELFTLEEDIACRNSPFTASPVVVGGRLIKLRPLHTHLQGLSEPDPPHNIPVVLPQASL